MLIATVMPKMRRTVCREVRPACRTGDSGRQGVLKAGSTVKEAARSRTTGSKAALRPDS